MEVHPESPAELIARVIDDPSSVVTELDAAIAAIDSEIDSVITPFVARKAALSKARAKVLSLVQPEAEAVTAESEATEAVSTDAAEQTAGEVTESVTDETAPQAAEETEATAEQPAESAQPAETAEAAATEVPGIYFG